MSTRVQRTRGIRPVALMLLTALLASGGAWRVGAAAESKQATPCAEPVPELFDRVSPVVVSIAATAINPYRLTDRVSHVLGSGVIIDRSGLILTNAHVAMGRVAIRVTLDDGTSLPARLVGADPIFDLAVLAIEPPADSVLPVAAVGDSDKIRVGEEVVALGNPLGLDQTLTRGIVSAINRILPETPFSLFLPLTPINPGNSGGPLLNRCGEVVGINTAVIAEAHNIGFAIPVNLAKAVLPSLVEHGRVIRPWVGFHGQIVGDSLRDLLRIPLVEGLLVEAVEPGSPAERAGLRGGQLELVIASHEILLGGDIITNLNGTRLSSPERLAEVMRALQVGDTLSLTIFRDGGYQEVQYTLPERPVLPGDLGQEGLTLPVTRRPPAPRGSTQAGLRAP